MEATDFSWALLQLKQGKKIARKGWNGKGMHLALVTGKSSHFILLENNEFHKVTTNNPYILMKTVDGLYQPGWLASQADILAEDWEVL